MVENEALEIEIVVAEGILSRDAARALHEEAARRGQSLFARLLVDGRISEATLASLRDNMTRQVTDELSTVSYAPAPADLRRPSDAFPVPGWERYEVIRLLGQGGMGRVFLARDLKLDRNVAIKFVRDDDPDLARRILDEARAQARVNDDRVCKVYEVGEVRGRVYIAMQHIDGRPLSELAS